MYLPPLREVQNAIGSGFVCSTVAHMSTDYQPLPTNANQRQHQQPGAWQSNPADPMTQLDGQGTGGLGAYSMPPPSGQPQPNAQQPQYAPQPYMQNPPGSAQPPPQFGYGQQPQYAPGPTGYEMQPMGAGTLPLPALPPGYFEERGKIVSRDRRLGHFIAGAACLVIGLLLVGLAVGGVKMFCRSEPAPSSPPANTTAVGPATSHRVFDALRRSRSGSRTSGSSRDRSCKNGYDRANWWQTIACAIPIAIGVVFLIFVKYFETSWDDQRRVVTVKNTRLILMFVPSAAVEVRYDDIHEIDFEVSGSSSSRVNGCLTSANANWDAWARTRGGQRYVVATFQTPTLTREFVDIYRAFFIKRVPSCRVNNPGIIANGMATNAML